MHDCFCAFKGLYCLDLRLGVKDLFMHKKHSLRALNIKITIKLAMVVFYFITSEFILNTKIFEQLKVAFAMM
jgi:hypothetical protein